MLSGIRDTAVMAPPVAALLAGASSNRRHPSPSSHHQASCTEPFRPTHHTSMLPGFRDTDVMGPAALPAGASSNRCHPDPLYQLASCTEPFRPTHHISMLPGIRDTDVMASPGETSAAGASSKCCQVERTCRCSNDSAWGLKRRARLSGE